MSDSSFKVAKVRLAASMALLIATLVALTLQVWVTPASADPIRGDEHMSVVEEGDCNWEEEWCTYYGVSTVNEWETQIIACDSKADGRGVYAEWYTYAGAYGAVVDGNGSQGGCGGATMAPSEYIYRFHVCVRNLGCDRWHYPE